MITKLHAIISLVPGAAVVVRGNDVGWITPAVAPVTDEQIETEYQRLVSLDGSITAIKAWQGMLWLGAHGHLETVQAAIDQVAPPAQVLAKMCMSAPDTIWKITDGIAQGIMSGVLGMTQEQIQAAFNEAGAYVWPI